MGVRNSYFFSICCLHLSLQKLKYINEDIFLNVKTKVNHPFTFFRLPICLASLLLIFDEEAITHLDDRNPNFIYGASQAIISVSLLVLCFIGEFSSQLQKFTFL